MNDRVRWMAVLGVLLGLLTPVWADALDLSFLLSRQHRSTFNIVVTVLFLMIVNYLVNVAFVVFPAKWYSSASMSRILAGVLLLTIVGQGVDWLSRSLAILVAGTVPQLLGDLASEAFERTFILSNFLFSGVWVGLTVYGLARYWW